MQIGDKVQVTGAVRDIVSGSVLVIADDDGHEYWFLERHVKASTPSAAPPAAEEAPATSETKKHKS